MYIVVVFADVFSEPIPARIGRTNAQEDDNNIPKQRSTNRWSFEYRTLTTISLCFDELAFMYRFVELFPRSSDATPSGKNIFRNNTKTHNFSSHKYDGYDLQKVFLGLGIPIETLVIVVQSEKPTL